MSLEKLEQLIDECSMWSADEVLTDPGWGTINFEECRVEFERTYSMLIQLKLLPIELLPSDQIAKIVNKLAPIKENIDLIRGFSIESSNPTGTRAGLVAQFRSLSDQFFTETHLYIPYLAYQQGDVQRSIGELTSSTNKARQLVDDAIGTMKEKQGIIDGILVATREAAASVGVAHFSNNFKNEADTQDKGAEKWLMTTGGLAAVTIVAALLMAFAIPVARDATAPQVFQLFTSKIVILGLLFTATIWCGRLYKAARHQSAINKHRANALRTFQAFTIAASDDETRSAVLMETTKSIFALTPSGYLDNETTSGNGLTVVEVLKHATREATEHKVSS